ncbi:MAG: serine/threonine-protein kinase, partial [Planctomycetota bacterium]
MTRALSGQQHEQTVRVADHVEQLVATETAILHFEKTWRHDDVARFDKAVAPLPDDVQHDILVELVRIDIEFVCEIGLDLDLAHYFRLYPSLAEDVDAMHAIAYEDFRCRAAAALPISVKRYAQALPASVLARLERERWWSEVEDFDAGDAGEGHFRSESLPQARALDPDEAKEAIALRKLGYDIVGSIGRGTQSNVYLCKQRTLLGRLVVLKVTQFGKSESEALSELRHSNIMPIHDVYRLGERTVLKMPYLGQLTLADFFADCPDPATRTGQSLIESIASREGGQDPAATPDDALTLQQLAGLGSEALALMLFTKLADALAHAHQRGILHCDIKPENILIGADGEPLLFDFNLARDRERNAPEAVGGTPPYMAPEALAELNSYRASSTRPASPVAAEGIDARADIYSLGLVAKEFLTGARGDRDLNPEGTSDVKVSPGTRSILNQCLEQAPERRYPNAETLRDDLRRQSAGRLLAHAPESAARCSIKLLRARPVPAVAAALVLIALSVIVPLSRREAKERRQNTRAALAAETASLKKQSAASLAAVMLDPNQRTRVPESTAWKMVERDRLTDVKAMTARFDAADSLGLEAEPQRLIVLRHLLQIVLHDLHTQYIAAGVGQLDHARLRRVESWLEAASELSADCQPQHSKAIGRSIAALRARIGTIRDRVDRPAEIVAAWQPLPSETPFDQYLCGVDLLLLGRWRAATTQFESLADHPEVASSLRWSGLGLSHFERYELDQAIACFTEAIKRLPDSSQLLTLRGRSFARQGR